MKAIVVQWARGCVALSALGAGCVIPDVEIRHPIASPGELTETKIDKQHAWAERANGLPAGTMTDEAVLEKLDEEEICVRVELHELSPIDLNHADVGFRSSLADIFSGVAPSIAAEEPSARTLEGRVPQEMKTGTREVCSYQGNQRICEVQPVYTTVMVPGPVEVYTTRGRLCVPNDELVTKETEKLWVTVSLPTERRGVLAGRGRGSKSVDFIWGFVK